MLECPNREIEKAVKNTPRSNLWDQYSDTTFEKAWNDCGDGIWMTSFLVVMDPNNANLHWVSIKTAYRAVSLVKELDRRSVLALVAKERWLKGEIRFDELNCAYYEALDAASFSNNSDADAFQAHAYSSCSSAAKITPSAIISVVDSAMNAAYYHKGPPDHEMGMLHRMEMAQFISRIVRECFPYKSLLKPRTRFERPWVI